MKKYGHEFTESIFGRRLQYNKRFKNKIFITYTPTNIFHTKKTKTKTRDLESLKFQEIILNYLESQKRSCFRGSVAIEFYIQISHKNPPAPHSIIKHYLDLIQKPLSKLETHRKYLLIKDDSQVKSLGYINHSSKEDVNTLSIYIYPNIHIIEDLILANKIEHKIDNDDNDLLRENDDELDFAIDISSLESINPEFAKKEKEFRALFKQQKDEEFKRKLFSINSRIGNNSLLYLLYDPAKIIRVDLKGLELISTMARMSLLQGLFSIDFGKVPTKEGEKEVYLENIKRIINEYKINIFRVLPKNALVSIKLFYEKPVNVNHDLDNLLINVLPHFQENILDTHTRFPLFSIELYQIRTLPENLNTGKLYLRIEEGGHNYSFFRINDALEKYFNKERFE